MTDSRFVMEITKVSNRPDNMPPSELETIPSTGKDQDTGAETEDSRGVDSEEAVEAKKDR